MTDHQGSGATNDGVEDCCGDAAAGDFEFVGGLGRSFRGGVGIGEKDTGAGGFEFVGILGRSFQGGLELEKKGCSIAAAGDLEFVRGLRQSFR